MPKLKSLRGAVGSYGRVAAGGIVDVSEDDAKKLLKTKRFTVATEADIKAAQERQKAELATETVGATAGFSAMPQPPEVKDRLTQMVKAGQISPEKARDLVSLQISLSTEEVQAFIKAEGDKMFAEVADAQRHLDTREAEIAERENSLAEREAALADREKALDDLSADLASREDALAKAQEKAKADAEAAAKAETAKAKADADKKAAK